MPVPRVGSSLLLGREPEIAELDEALALATEGTSQIVLVGGDAGIGKTTLVADLERRAAVLGFSVATGHCLDIQAGISFAPVVEAVRSLLGEVDVQTRPAARRMLTLLDPEAPRSRERLHLLDDLTAATLESAAAGPVLLVLEDMHWADQSTQDFAATLSRTARGALLFVLTFRSDDLHRRHPFRKTVAEISRTLGSRRIDLGGLDHDDIAGIVAAHTDGPPDPSVVDSVLARSEGNPLYAEELLAANQQGVPDHLSDLLLARIDGLDEGPRALLRVGSVNGTRLDTETLGDLAGLDRTQTEGYLREALDANVLRQTDESLEFRHPLLREVAYDDLMPDERTRIHGRLAEILQARVEAEPDPGSASLSRLAFHWNAAHDVPRTLAASVRAGLAAKRLGAAEAIPQLERALALWDRVPDAEAFAQHPRAELIVLLGESALAQGDRERWHALIRESVNMLGPDPDRLLASRVYSALGECHVFTDATVGRQEAIRLAVVYAGEQPTEELARALVAQSSYYMYCDGNFTECLVTATRAVEVAKLAESPDVLIDALSHCAWALADLGRIEAGLAVQREVIQVNRDAGRIGGAIVEAAELAEFYNYYAGNVHRGLEVGRRGFEEGMAQGLPVQAASCGAQVHTALTWLGRFEEAELLLDELPELGISGDGWSTPHVDLLLARGDAEAAPPSDARDQEQDPRKPKPVRHPAPSSSSQRCSTTYRSASKLLDRPRARSTNATPRSTLPAAARIGFHALALAQSTPESRIDGLRERASASTPDGSCRAHRGVARRPTSGSSWHSPRPTPRRCAGEPAVAQFRRRRTWRNLSVPTSPSNRA